VNDSVNRTTSVHVYHVLVVLAYTRLYIRFQLLVTLAKCTIHAVIVLWLPALQYCMMSHYSPTCLKEPFISQTLFTPQL